MMETKEDVQNNCQIFQDFRYALAPMHECFFEILKLLKQSQDTADRMKLLSTKLPKLQATLGYLLTIVSTSQELMQRIPLEYGEKDIGQYCQLFALRLASFDPRNQPWVNIRIDHNQIQEEFQCYFQSFIHIFAQLQHQLLVLNERKEKLVGLFESMAHQKHNLSYASNVRLTKNNATTVAKERDTEPKEYWPRPQDIQKLEQLEQDPIFLQVQRLQSQIGAYFEEMWSFLSPHIEVLETIAAANASVSLPSEQEMIGSCQDMMNNVETFKARLTLYPEEVVNNLVAFEGLVEKDQFTVRKSVLKLELTKRLDVALFQAFIQDWLESQKELHAMLKSTRYHRAKNSVDQYKKQLYQKWLEAVK